MIEGKNPDPNSMQEDVCNFRNDFKKLMQDVSSISVPRR